MFKYRNAGSFRNKNMFKYINAGDFKKASNTSHFMDLTFLLILVPALADGPVGTYVTCVWISCEILTVELTFDFSVTFL